MTRKTVTITEERDVCDFCQDESKEAWHHCPICGKSACSECGKSHFTHRTSTKYISKGGEDVFCNACIANPPPKFAALMALYDRMDDLIATEKAFYAAQKAAQGDLEAKIDAEKKKVLG